MVACLRCSLQGSPIKIRVFRDPREAAEWLESVAGGADA